MSRIAFKDREELATRLFPPGGIVLELGVQRGNFSAVVVEACPELKALILVDAWRFLPGSYEIDPADAADPEHERAWQECRAKMYDEQNVSMVRLLSAEAAQLFADDSLDAVYIDCDHTRQGITADLALWWPKVKPGGWLCGHDWLEVGQERTWVQVREVVEEFAERRGLEILLSGELDWKSWAMQRPA